MKKYFYTNGTDKLGPFSLEELKSENEYLKIQLQARAKTESEVFASLDNNEMDEEEEAFSMA